MYPSALIALLYSLTICQGALLYSSGNKVLSFDGNGGGVINLIDTFQGVNGNDPRSISFDIKTNQTYNGGIFSTGSACSKQAFNVVLGDQTNTPGSIGVVGWEMDYNPGSPRIDDGSWHSVLITWDRKILKIYHENGMTASTTLPTYNPSGSSSLHYDTKGNKNFLGDENYASSFHFQGELKNIKYFNDTQSFTKPTSTPSTVPPSTYKTSTATPSIIKLSTASPSTLTPSTSMPTTAIPTTTSLPSLAPTINPTILLCPAGWTTYYGYGCQRTGATLSQGASGVPQSPQDVMTSMLVDNNNNNNKYFIGGVVGSIVTLIIVAALHSCVQRGKSGLRRSEYNPIMDQE